MRGILSGQRKVNFSYFQTLWPRLRDRLRLQPPAYPKDADDSTDLVVDYYANLSFQYHPLPVPLPVLLIQSEETFFNLKIAWDFLSQGSVTQKWVPGNHRDLVEPPNAMGAKNLIRQHLAARQ